VIGITSRIATIQWFAPAPSLEFRRGAVGEPQAAFFNPSSERSIVMDAVMTLHPLAAIGYSLVYMLLGGGLGGAVLIFIVAKMLGK